MIGSRTFLRVGQPHTQITKRKSRIAHESWRCGVAKTSPEVQAGGARYLGGVKEGKHGCPLPL